MMSALLVLQRSEAARTSQGVWILVFSVDEAEPLTLTCQMETLKTS